MVNYLRLLRPTHWVKNLFLFAAPFFGGSLFSAGFLQPAALSFVAFSFAASSIYILNDIYDIESDRLHPKKHTRPIASGVISKNSGYLFSSFLVVLSLILAYSIGREFILFVILYILIHVGYSLFLKKIPLVDIFCIASGFVIRVLAGGAAFQVDISQWLLLTMFMISLVLASGKRLGEVKLREDKAEADRESFSIYSISTLREILLISAAAALIAYSLYTVEQFHRLVYTVPIVSFGLFRYLMLARQGLGDPTEAMTKDKWLSIAVFFWLLLVSMIRYNAL
jgi:4-hydroxybenzoate polyprenyltransferase